MHCAAAGIAAAGSVDCDANGVGAGGGIGVQYTCACACVTIAKVPYYTICKGGGACVHTAYGVVASICKCSGHSAYAYCYISAHFVLLPQAVYAVTQAW